MSTFDYYIVGKAIGMVLGAVFFVGYFVREYFRK